MPPLLLVRADEVTNEEGREFITLLGGAVVAWPLVARAQQPAKARIGIASIQPRTAPNYAAFDQRLRELGHVEGQNLVVDFLNPEFQAEGGFVCRSHLEGGQPGGTSGASARQI